MYRISSDHPALNGHFPGNPIVPGVMILTHVSKHLSDKGLRIMLFDNVKFLAPLHPEQAFEIKLAGEENIYTFQVLVNHKPVAKGKIKTEVIEK